LENPLISSARVVDGPPDIASPGDEIVIVNAVNVDGVGLTIPKALPGLTDYVAAANAEERANELRPRLTQGLDPKGGSLPYQPDAELVFEYLGAATAAAGSAVVGLEAFANHHVARFVAPPSFDENGDEVGPTPTIQFVGNTRSFRELVDISLNERYADVLPVLLDKPSPTSEPWWPVLRRIQGIAALDRHGVIGAVARKGLEGKKQLVQRLCDREYRGASQMMLAVFEYFAPGWIDPERMAALPSPSEN
jgi:hypothetical protein